MSQAAAANSPATARDAVASNGAIIAFRGVCKRFGTLEVLRDIDIELRRGETTVIIGASGAGKSVVLKHIVRLLRPDRGEVFFKGRRIDDLPERDLVELRKHFGFLFQMGALFDSLTVAENIAFPVREHTRRGKKEVADLVREKLAMVGLDGTQDKKPASFPAGNANASLSPGPSPSIPR
jgi:phospholipid/cholesterol/gamma-HCH transport system ATP-binding protein